MENAVEALVMAGSIFLLIIALTLDVKGIDKDKVTFKFTIVEKPEIKLGDYTKLGIKKDKVSVTKKEIEAEIKKNKKRKF